MSKSSNQKQKILYVAKFFEERTDENHEASVAELIQYLDEHEIGAERKSLYDDIQALNDFGYDIVRSPGPRGGYSLVSRDFELSEVKLLVDLVQSSKFITESKSRELIRKLEKLVSHNDALGLQRQVVVADRNKTANENIYYNVDMIHQAMARNVKVRFHYYEWDVNKKPVLRKGGDYYEVSPWILTWDDENYYLVAYDDEAEVMKHYRVDKMLHAEVTDHVRRGRAAYEKIDIATYTRQTFGMFHGMERTVQLLCTKGLTGVIVDRFGTDVALRAFDEEHVLARMNVKVSQQFFGWLSGFGNRMKIYGPADVAEEYQAYIRSILEQYES